MAHQLNIKQTCYVEHVFNFALYQHCRPRCRKRSMAREWGRGGCVWRAAIRPTALAASESRDRGRFRLDLRPTPRTKREWPKRTCGDMRLWIASGPKWHLFSRYSVKSAAHVLSKLPEVLIMCYEKSHKVSNLLPSGLALKSVSLLSFFALTRPSQAQAQWKKKSTKFHHS